MIDNALILIKEELGNYLELHKRPGDLGLTSNSVVLDNVADLEKSNNNTLENKVIISLVNIEEESTYKNIKSYRKNHWTKELEYTNSPVFLNLYILFSCTLANGVDKYQKALNRLGLVIQFFQSKKSFTLKNSPNFKIDDPSAIQENEMRNIQDLKIIMDLYTLTFEQINHLWGSLGGKQVPFAMYKVRLVKIEDQQIQRSGTVITEIHSKEKIY